MNIVTAVFNVKTEEGVLDEVLFETEDEVFIGDMDDHFIVSTLTAEGDDVPTPEAYVVKNQLLYILVESFKEAV